VAFFIFLERLLKRRYLKWACIAHLDIWNTSYGQKKVGNRPDLLSYRQRATYRWKALDESYNFASNHTSIRGFLVKLWGSKVSIVPIGAISGLPFGVGVPGEKSRLDVGLVERCRVYYKGEGGGFPQVWAVVSLVCPCCPWFVLTPKVLQLCTNHLVWVVCRLVWVSEACQLFLVPSQSFNASLHSYNLYMIPRLFSLG
jgi:hypothetical protein